MLSEILNQQTGKEKKECFRSYMNLIETPELIRKLSLLSYQYLEYSGITIKDIEQGRKTALPIDIKNLKLLLNCEPINKNAINKLAEYFS